MLFREEVKKHYGDIGLASVVGCGIDRLTEEQREYFTEDQMHKVIQHYSDNKQEFDKMSTLSEQREVIKQYCEKEFHL